MIDKECIKCQTLLTKCSAVEACGMLTLLKIKDPIKASEVKSKYRLNAYVCSNCGYVEWYVDNPEDYK